MVGTMKTAVMLGIGKMGFEERKIPNSFWPIFMILSENLCNISVY